MLPQHHSHCLSACHAASAPLMLLQHHSHDVLSRCLSTCCLSTSHTTCLSGLRKLLLNPEVSLSRVFNKTRSQESITKEQLWTLLHTQHKGASESEMKSIMDRFDYDRDGKIGTCLTVSLSHCLCLTVCVSLSDCLGLSLAVSVSLSLSHCLCLTVSLSLSLSVSHCLCLTACVSLPLSHFRTLAVSFSPDIYATDYQEFVHELLEIPLPAAIKKKLRTAIVTRQDAPPLKGRAKLMLGSLKEQCKFSSIQNAKLLGLFNK